MAALAGTNHNRESEQSLLEHVLDVPEMYGTENQTYGKGKMVLVWDRERAHSIHYSPDLAIFVQSLNNGCLAQFDLKPNGSFGKYVYIFVLLFIWP